MAARPHGARSRVNAPSMLRLQSAEARSGHRGGRYRIGGLVEARPGQAACEWRGAKVTVLRTVLLALEECECPRSN